MSASSVSPASAPSAGDAPRNHHWVMLAVATAIMAAAAVLEVRPEERVAIHGMPNYPLPHLCMSRALLGLSCPGCGLTRSFVYLAHGQWDQARHVHRVGWLLAVLVVLQIPYRGLILARLIRPLSSRAAQWLALGLLVVLITNWLFTLAVGCF